MEMRVEQLSVRSEVSVDTIRYYQSKGLLDPPRRQGRVAWYGEGHLDRLARIRTLQQRGFTLATIARVVSGELDAADEALIGELTGWHDGQGRTPAPPEPGPDGPNPAPNGSEPGTTLTIEELAGATGVPLALLKAVEAEGLLIPRRVRGLDRYTEEDVAAARAGLLLLEWGIPLSALLDLARRHHEATEAVAREAVAMFSVHVRGPLRRDQPADGAESSDEEPHIERLLQAYAELLPAVNELVGHHFTRTLVNVALDHVEAVGSDAERQAIGDRAAAGDAVPAGPDLDPEPAARR
ncbi:MAG: MerR family transcriptional regulator [Acidimicrobiales bacterium]|jgi:DNA-binding transcriptional MerR regulator